MRQCFKVTNTMMVLLALLVTGAWVPPAPAQRGRPDAFVIEVGERVSEILATITDRATLNNAHSQLQSLADSVSAQASARQEGAMVAAEGALGAIGLATSGSDPDAPGLVALLAQHPGFMTQLGLLVTPKDNATEVVRLARQLMSERGAQVDRFPALAAAVCVVHDQAPGQHFTRRVNENNPVAPEPIEIFDFFANNAGSMTIAPDRLPAIALVYVVDVTEPIEELLWANRAYHTSPGIGQRFKEVVYDQDHFESGQQKLVNKMAGEYRLRKIKQYGGVCADQAYYAMSVAKACGLPSAYVRARGADSSHAWVGFVEVRGRRMAWNFDEGRYLAYQNLRGNTLDPQTGETISDGRLGIIGASLGQSDDEVLASAAAARVVDRMNKGRWRPAKDTGIEAGGSLRTPRTGSIEDRLALLRSVLGQSAGVPIAWDAVTDIAKSGPMDEKQMDVWTRAVIQLAGRQHQDFAYDFLVDLISTVEDVQRQQQLWEWAFGQFRARPDLAAGIRFKQGQMWADEGNSEYAWLAYQDVVDRFLNQGPMAVSALLAMGDMLDKEGKRQAIVPVLEKASRSVRRPPDMAQQFSQQSNYYRINLMLADEYQRQGRTQDAQRIRSMTGIKQDAP